MKIVFEIFSENMLWAPARAGLIIKRCVGRGSRILIALRVAVYQTYFSILHPFAPALVKLLQCRTGGICFIFFYTPLFFR